MEDAEDECRGEHNEPGKKRKIGEREMNREKKKVATQAQKKNRKNKIQYTIT